MVVLRHGIQVETRYQMSVRCRTCYGTAVIFMMEKYWCGTCAWKETIRSETFHAGRAGRTVYPAVSPPNNPPEARERQEEE